MGNGIPFQILVYGIHEGKNKEGKPWASLDFYSDSLRARSSFVPVEMVESLKGYIGQSVPAELVISERGGKVYFNVRSLDGTILRN